MRFTLEIELGNDAMQSVEDVAECLNRTADKLWTVGQLADGWNQGNVFDVNGNTIGKWELS